MREIKYIVLHHSVITQSVQPDSEKMIQSMARNHAQRIGQPADKNWSTVAYHYFVWINWDIHRTREHESVGRANSNREVNDHAINICVHWYFDSEKPNKQQLDATRKIVLDLLKIYPNATLHWHREFADKTCPGDNFPSVMAFGVPRDEIRKWQTYADANSTVMRHLADDNLELQQTIHRANELIYRTYGVIWVNYNKQNKNR